MKDLPKVPDLLPPVPDTSNEKRRQARPWDMFNKNLGRVEESIHKERFALCLECPHLIQLTKQCTKCGCFMEMKTKLPNAFCPIGKWDAVDIDEENIPYKEES